MRSFTSFVLLASLSSVACDDASETDDDGTSTTTTTSSSSTTTASSTATSSSTGGEPLACPAPTHGPTIHDAAIEADETWTADTGPHIVKSAVGVRDGATLTIEACATVELEAGASLAVAFPGTPTTGTLVAEGSADQPIAFRGKDGARWGHLHVDAGGSARLAHVTLDGGGSIDPTGASLLVEGDGTFPVKKNVVARHVAVKGSLGAGVRVHRLAAFSALSEDLTVTGSGNDANPYPVVVDEHAIGTLPRGSYTGNAIDTILVDPELHLEESATMKNLGVPYRIGTAPNDGFVVGGGPDEPLTLFSIEAGTRIEMFPGTGFRVEMATGDFAASGSLVAKGTAAAPIVFTSAADAPAKGDWQGLWFGGIPAGENQLEHVRIEYTGADCGCVLASCSAITENEGAIIFAGEPASAFITDTTIAHGSGHAIVRGYLGAAVDFRDGVTVDDVDGCTQTLPSAPSCPSPKPACE